MAIERIAHSHVPQRTCTGCRTIEAQRALVRVGVGAGGLVLDQGRRLPGRGAYVHARAACVTVAGLARSFRRSVTPKDVQRLVREMSPSDDNSGDLQAKNGSGLGVTNTVEPPTPGDQQ